MRILILSDGMPGHFNQSIGIAKILSEEIEVVYEVVESKLKFNALRSISMQLQKLLVINLNLFKANLILSFFYKIDLDKFDQYYHHMFLWDDDAQMIAGAYRMGLGSKIFPKYGLEGFYLNELFKFEPELNDMMSHSIEMGRAFIISQYQQKPMPLFLLWKGIVHTTLRYPEHKYLIRGVSISNKFSEFSKSLMIEFMKSNYYDPYVAQYINPKKEYKVKLKDADKDFVFDASKADLNKFDKIIDEVEPGSLRLPVLIKKYIKQNAKVIAFNVDPLFNNAVDGLMYIRISDLPESTVKPVMEEFQSEWKKKINFPKDQ